MNPDKLKYTWNSASHFWVFHDFRSGPGFQIWVLNLRFTSYFNFSFNEFLSNCWLLVFDFLQGSAVKPRFWKFFSVNYCSFPLLISTWFLKSLVWKIKFNELDFLYISNWIFAGYTGSKNQVRNRQQIQFVELDFSN